ncbi:MAG: DUF1036 domain-containing protein [Brevundimonas sp.]|uniref:DUF1036 domain-containing protein n=1 Tax=Brevundimonas sp. TaxID=1871086 RepID=UPI002715FE50|nr:DUF1036 domain-containing protein [Brevundimonas sp.]MDO9608667.1 DUF1036 domain-containing protein [Brevundimonas sp.]
MKAMTCATVAACLILAAAPPAMAGPAPVSAPQATVELKVCNQSGRDATVAVSYVEVGSGRFINRGWYAVANGVCTDLVSTDNSNFYMYADATDGSGRSWSGNHALCVEYPGPYTFWSTGSEYCDDHQEVKNFVAMHADNPGDYTWTLDP